MSSCVDAVNERDVKGMQIKILYTMLSYTKSFFVNGIQSNIHKENIYNEIDLVEFVILDTFSKFNLGACSIHDYQGFDSIRLYIKRNLPRILTVCLISVGL